MAKLVSFVGTTFATSQMETFVGNDGSDTVSYALLGTGVNIGDYTSGISVNLATGAGSLLDGRWEIRMLASKTSSGASIRMS
jgi:hypothetical protein